MKKTLFLLPLILFILVGCDYQYPPYFELGETINLDRIDVKVTFDEFDFEIDNENFIFYFTFSFEATEKNIYLDTSKDQNMHGTQTTNYYYTDINSNIENNGYDINERELKDITTYTFTYIIPTIEYPTYLEEKVLVNLYFDGYQVYHMVNFS